MRPDIISILECSRKANSRVHLHLPDALCVSPRCRCSSFSPSGPRRGASGLRREMWSRCSRRGASSATPAPIRRAGSISREKTRCSRCEGSRDARQASTRAGAVEDGRVRARCRRRKPLSADEKAVLKEWIAGGAKWGTDPIDAFAATTAKRAGRDWWSRLPTDVKKPAVPSRRARACGAEPDRRFPSDRSSPKKGMASLPRKRIEGCSFGGCTSTCSACPRATKRSKRFPRMTGGRTHTRSSSNKPARVAPLRRALGALLARRRPVRRDVRVRTRSGEAGRLEVPRLGGEGIQRRHAVRPVRAGTARRRRDLRRDASRGDRGGHGLHPPRHLERRAERSERIQVRPARRHGRRDDHRVPRSHRKVRAVPRSQVRRDPPDRLLPHGGGILGRLRRLPGLPREHLPRRAGREGARPRRRVRLDRPRARSSADQAPQEGRPEPPRRSRRTGAPFGRSPHSTKPFGGPARRGREDDHAAAATPPGGSSIPRTRSRPASG